MAPTCRTDFDLLSRKAAELSRIVERTAADPVDEAVQDDIDRLDAPFAMLGERAAEVSGVCIGVRDRDVVSALDLPSTKEEDQNGCNKRMLLPGCEIFECGRDEMKEMRASSINHPDINRPDCHVEATARRGRPAFFFIR